MKDVLTGIAAVMAAISTVMSFLLSPDVSKYQDKLARKRRVDAPDVLDAARNRQLAYRILFLAAPGFLAVVLCIWALFVHPPAK